MQLSFLQAMDVAASQLGSNPTTENVRRIIAGISDRVNAELDPSRKAQYAQFFTPAAVAAQMARMLPAGTNAIIGDYGAGAGILGATAALFQQALHQSPARGVQAFEIDTELHRHIEATMSAVSRFYEGQGDQGLELDLNGDFLDGLERIAAQNHESDRLVDSIILNPPYTKISRQSELGRRLGEIGQYVPNLYALFMLIAMTWLKPGGSMVAIVPRSFTSGAYFQGFRRWLRMHGNIDWMVRYECRSNLFRRDNVLQENLILRVQKGTPQQDRIRVTVCPDAESDPSMDMDVPASTILPKDAGGIIRVPASRRELAAVDKINALTLTMPDFGIGVSTGKVEEFRVRQWLEENRSANNVPMLYAGHWDRHETTITRLGTPVGTKRAFLARNEDTETKLLPAGYYIVLKRISANDDAGGRIHAALLTPGCFPTSHIAVENHVQVIHQNGGGLPEKIARGLLAYLRSDRANSFMSAISGTTQVNVSDLAELRLPSEVRLMAIGQRAYI